MVFTGITQVVIIIDDEAFAPASYLDPSIRPLMNNIKVTADDGIEKEVQDGNIHVRVIAKDHSGKSYEVNILNPVGHAKNPFTEKELATKFKRLCEPALGKRRTTKALAQWRNIDTAADVKAAFDSINIKGASSKR